MGNLKHTIAAMAAVSLVGSLAAVQIADFSAVNADKLAQENQIVETIQAPEVLIGDGEGITADFSVATPATQIFLGKDAYVLTDGGSINLRAAADVESVILNVLPLGTQVKVVDADEDWLKVECGEHTGYVKLQYLTLDYSKVRSVMLNTTMYLSGSVNQSINVRAEASEEAVIIDQVFEGTNITILEQTTDGWYKIYFGENYDIGYVAAEYVTVGDMVSRDKIAKARNERIAKISKKAKIKTSGANVSVKLMPSEDSETIATLANNADCRIVSGGSNWTKIIISATNEIGYVKTANVAETIIKTAKTTTSSSKTKSISKSSGSSSSGKGSSLVAMAEKYLGVKYVYGGTSPKGFDCSGLVQYCCRKLGVSVNRTARAQYSNGVAVSRDNLKPGDLIFFSRGSSKSITHVVIYAGNGQVIHAPRTGRTVSYQSLSSICSYSRYVGARRVM